MKARALRDDAVVRVRIQTEPPVVLQAGFSARPSLERRMAKPEFYKPSGKLIFGIFHFGLALAFGGKAIHEVGDL